MLFAKGSDLDSGCAWFLYIPGWGFVLSSLGQGSYGWRHARFVDDSRSETG
jgi:hypothetical protein